MAPRVIIFVRMLLVVLTGLLSAFAEAAPTHVLACASSENVPAEGTTSEESVCTKSDLLRRGAQQNLRKRPDRPIADAGKIVPPAMHLDLALFARSVRPLPYRMQRRDNGIGRSLLI